MKTNHVASAACVSLWFFLGGFLACRLTLQEPASTQHVAVTPGGPSAKELAVTIKFGMSPAQVQTILGDPKSKSEARDPTGLDGSNPNFPFETWIYETSSGPLTIKFSGPYVSKIVY